MLGPGAGAAILATIGYAACFALNGLSFFIVVLALISMRKSVGAAAPACLGHPFKPTA